MCARAMTRAMGTVTTMARAMGTVTAMARAMRMGMATAMALAVATATQPIQLWTVSDGHGFQVLQFAKSFTAQHKDLFANTVTTEQSR